MTYRPAGSRSVEEVSASLAGARERAAQAREGTRQDLERHAQRRARPDRAEAPALPPAEPLPGSSALPPSEGERVPGTEAARAEAPSLDTPSMPATDEAPPPVHSGQEPAASVVALSSEPPDPPSVKPERPANPPTPAPSPVAPEGASQAATSSFQRRTNAEKRTAVLELLQAEPDASDREIARRVDVSPQTVSNIRKTLA